MEGCCGFAGRFQVQHVNGGRIAAARGSSLMKVLIAFARAVAKEG